MALLARCDHPHLLPLLGYCRSAEAPCLLFPLMEGGSLEHRLFLSDDHVESIRQLGHFTAPPKPLTWRQRLRVVLQASRGLLYLHGMSCVHRDFKPANILLQADLHARLADTGFAKAAADGDVAGTKHASITSRGVCHTTGYADPLIMSAGGFSAKTDAYAVGMTLLVCLSGRPAVSGNDGLIDSFEEEFEQIFGEIEPRWSELNRRLPSPPLLSTSPLHRSSPPLSRLAALHLSPSSHPLLSPARPLTLSALADPSVNWPAAVCRSLVPLVLSTEKELSLCNRSKFKRLHLADALEKIARFEAGPAEAAASDVAAADEPAATAASIPAAGGGTSEVSKLVRNLGRKATCHDDGAEEAHRLQQKASQSFKDLMARLDRLHAARHAAAETPAGFEERLRFWRHTAAITEALHGKMHTLRRWRNAAEHDDLERWRSEGPGDAAELVRVLLECDAAVTKMEGR